MSVLEAGGRDIYCRIKDFTRRPKEKCTITILGTVPDYMRIIQHQLVQCFKETGDFEQAESSALLA